MRYRESICLVEIDIPFASTYSMRFDDDLQGSEENKAIGGGWRRICPIWMEFGEFQYTRHSIGNMNRIRGRGDSIDSQQLLLGH